MAVAKDRCKDSFHILFQFYSSKIYTYGKTHQLNDAEASDLVQEVMSRVWLKAHLYDTSKANASTWIFTLTRNLRYDILRKKIRDRNIITSENLWDLALSTTIDTDSNIDLIQDKKEIRSVINQLPENQKNVINEVYFKGLTQEEFALKNKVPLGTVKSRIRLAFRKLNELMRDL